MSRSREAMSASASDKHEMEHHRRHDPMIRLRISRVTAPVIFVLAVLALVVGYGVCELVAP